MLQNVEEMLLFKFVRENYIRLTTRLYVVHIDYQILKIINLRINCFKI